MSSNNIDNPTLALTIVDFGVEELIFFSGNYDIKDICNSRECMGVEIEPHASEAIINVSSKVSGQISTKHVHPKNLNKEPLHTETS